MYILIILVIIIGYPHLYIIHEQYIIWPVKSQDLQLLFNLYFLNI